MHILSKIVALAVALFLAGCQNPMQEHSALGFVKSFSGEVFYYPAASAQRVKLQPNDLNRPLYHLDKIVASDQSYVHILIPTQGDLFVEPQTSLVIQKPADDKKFKTFVNLLKGVLDCFIEKKNSNFAVQTPVAVAGVLGTSFKISHAESGTKVILVESEKGIELQNLTQSLRDPLVLKTSLSPQGIISGQEIMLAAEPLEKNSMMMLASNGKAAGAVTGRNADLASGIASAFEPGALAPGSAPVTVSEAKSIEATSDSSIVQPVENASSIQFPSGFKDGAILWKSMLDHHSRVSSFQR